jgi:4-oxalocrotonate tautomerase
MVDVLGKKPESTYVLIDEVSHDNWGVNGHSVSKQRKLRSL